jgi:hypothetical protein
MRVKGYKKLITTVGKILGGEPQDIIDEEEGLIYVGGLWELVHPRHVDESDEALAPDLKAELLENPRKIGSANLLYVQNMIEKYWQDNPVVITKKLPPTSNVVNKEECVKAFTTHVLDELVQERLVRIIPDIKRKQVLKLVVDNTEKEDRNVAI